MAIFLFYSYCFRICHCMYAFDTPGASPFGKATGTGVASLGAGRCSAPRPGETQGIKPTEGAFARKMAAAGAKPAANSTSAAPSSTRQPTAASAGIRPTEGDFARKMVAAGPAGPAAPAASASSELLCFLLSLLLYLLLYCTQHLGECW
jgi:hypothetical protein